MSGLQQQHGLKRREPDDLVQDLLNVSLSPPKKLRASDLGVTARSGLGWNAASTGILSESPWGLSPLTPAVPSSVAISPAAAAPQPVVTQDEKALVLYRPVTPPMFPGGPPAGSVDFPYKVNSAMLPIPQGTDSELTLNQLDCQSACSNDTDPVSGHGLFQALDLSGGPVSYLGQRRLNRVSSCSSLPRFSSDNEDQVMVEEIDSNLSDLAVIPWVPMTPLVVPPKIRPLIEEVDDDSPDGGEDTDDMVDEDSMEVVNENQVIVTEDSITQPIAGQFGIPMQNFSAAPWQAEPPFTTPMWTH